MPAIEDSGGSTVAKEVDSRQPQKIELLAKALSMKRFGPENIDIWSNVFMLTLFAHQLQKT